LEIPIVLCALGDTKSENLQLRELRRSALIIKTKFASGVGKVLTPSLDIAPTKRT